MNEAIETDAQAVPVDEAPVAEAPGGAQQLAFRPLLDLIPGMPSGQVCGPDGCAPLD